MQKHSLTQAEMIAALTGYDADRRRLVLRYLFEHSALRRLTLAHVGKYGGNRQDAEDVFQEAVIVFDRKLRQGAFRGESNLETYFMGIVRWYWFNEQHRTGRGAFVTNENPPEPPPGGNPELEYLLTERREQLDKLIEQLADKCRNLLKMYQLDFSMDEIARLMGYANSGVAKKEAFLCRQRLRTLLNQHPEIWQDLIKRKRP
ncbi:MAG: sigma-70 family RNA polymerase sigma factor [Saprospirales bacterium]|nr:sigma-70 family RNA polymerase sigma factor [Saprospirales bacterium]MBK8921088.1 sigma-70 family RNA polymerase sigma factor [Saprospirales bacterium]